jgi:hypothetical protein
MTVITLRKSVIILFLIQDIRAIAKSIFLLFFPCGTSLLSMSKDLRFLCDLCGYIIQHLFQK